MNTFCQSSRSTLLLLVLARQGREEVKASTVILFVHSLLQCSWISEQARVRVDDPSSPANFVQRKRVHHLLFNFLSVFIIIHTRKPKIHDTQSGMRRLIYCRANPVKVPGSQNNSVSFLHYLLSSNIQYTKFSAFHTTALTTTVDYSPTTLYHSTIYSIVEQDYNSNQTDPCGSCLYLII